MKKIQYSLHQFQLVSLICAKDRREFAGSLMQQLNEVYDYIDFHNQTHATFQKLLRIDTRDYPEVAVREALLNSMVCPAWHIALITARWRASGAS